MERGVALPLPPAPLRVLPYTGEQDAVCLPHCLSASRYSSSNTEAGTPWRQGTAQGTGLTLGETGVLSEQRALCWPPRGMEGRELDGMQPGARLWMDGRGREGSHGGKYLGSAYSAPRAAPGRAPAARGRSGPGQVPHWGREQEQGRWGCPSRTLIAGCEIHHCLPVTPSQGRLLPPSTPLVDPSVVVLHVSSRPASTSEDSSLTGLGLA